MPLKPGRFLLEPGIRNDFGELLDAFVAESGGHAFEDAIRHDMVVLREERLGFFGQRVDVEGAPDLAADLFVLNKVIALEHVEVRANSHRNQTDPGGKLLECRLPFFFSMFRISRRVRCTSTSEALEWS